MKIRLYLFILLLNVLIINQLNAQWTTNGPFGGYITSGVQVGNQYIIGARPGIFKSSNGLNFTYVPSNLPSGYSVQYLHYDGEVLFAQIDQKGIFISSDTGKSWTNSTQTIGKPYQSWEFFSIGNKVFNQNVNGTFYTSDHGQTWTKINTPLPFLFDRVSAAGNLLFQAQSSTPKVLYMSNNFGTSWVKADTGLLGTPKFIAQLGGVYYSIGTRINSSTNGTLWTPMSKTEVKNAQGYAFQPSLILIDNNTVLASSGGNLNVEIKKYTAGDTNWMDYTNGLPDGYTNALFSMGGNYFISKDATFYYSQNKGSSWNINVSSGIAATVIYSISGNGNQVFAGGEKIIYTSVDNGQNWSQNAKIFESEITDIFDFNSKRFTLVGGKGIFVSEDNGATWPTQLYKSLGFNRMISDGNNLYATKQLSSGIVKSTDNGKTFLNLGTELPSGINLDMVFMNDRLYTHIIPFTPGGDNFGVFKLDPVTNKWYKRNNGLPAEPYVISLEGGQGKLYAGTDGYGVFVSTDTSESWTLLGKGLLKQTIHDLLLVGKDLLAISDSGIFILYNDSLNWKNLNYNLPNRELKSVYFSNGTVHVATDGAGVWQMKLPLKAQIKNANPFQNVVIYPNPIQSNLTLNFLPSACILEIRNISGSLCHMESIIPSNGSAVVDLSGLRSGLYIATIKNNWGQSNIKLIKN